MRHLLLSCCVTLLCLPAALAAADPVTGEPTGAFTYAGIHFDLLVQGSGLTATSTAVRPTDGWPRQDGATWQTRGSIPVRDGVTIAIEEKLTTRDDGSCDVDLKLATRDALPMQNVALVAELPVDAFAGRSLSYNGGAEILHMDANTGGMLAGHWKSNIATISVPVPGHALTITGNLASSVADERAWGLKRFGLRLLCVRPDANTLTTATLTFHLAPAPK